MKPTKDWLKKYNSAKYLLNSSIDLDAYFTLKKIGNVKVDLLDIGNVHFPTGKILACDLWNLKDAAESYFQTIPPGTYPVTICVILNKCRYACVKVSVSDKKPARYETALLGNEKLEELNGSGDYFGFEVDSGMGCIVDAKTQEYYKNYLLNFADNDNFSVYDDIFAELLEENCQRAPKYQKICGDWLNWTIPGTDVSIPLFAAGWGDGVYPCYFGYDKENNVCGVYIQFIDIESDFADDARFHDTDCDDDAFDEEAFEKCLKEFYENQNIDE